jgi:replication initiation and membrane attachment protein DnaB
MTVSIKYAYPLSIQDHTLLNLMYQPIIKKEALSVFLTLNSLFQSGIKKPLKTDLYDICGLNPESFEEALKKCESVFLLSYDEKKESVYLNQVLSVLAFFESPLIAILKTHVSSDFILSLKGLIPPKNSLKNSEPSLLKLQHAQNPFERVKSPLDVDAILESLPSSLVQKKLKQEDLKTMMHHVSYLYDLDMPQMNKLMITFLKQEIHSFEKLSDLAHQMFTTGEAPKSFDVSYFKKAHPKEVLKDLTGSHVPASDLKTVDTLIQNSGLKLEVIGVLIAFVISELNGQMPVYKYFEKVSGQWHRNQIKTAEEAIAHIKTIKQKPSRNAPKKGSDIPWFDDYLKKKEDR